MKRTLSIALVAALSLIFFLAVVHAQEEGGGKAVPEQLEQELAMMETVFGDLESFIGELVAEIKGNMADVEDLFGETRNLRDMLHAVSIEIKEAEGKIVGLRDEVDRMVGVQQEFKVRIIALEAGLSELSAFYSAFKVSILADISALKKGHEDLVARVQKIEDDDVGTFKKKVLELERTMSALSIKIDNNRAKLEGFDHAIAGLANDIEANKSGILANMSLLEDHETRLLALEDGTMVADLQGQVSTLYFLVIIALLAGVGALIWGFMGT